MNPWIVMKLPVTSGESDVDVNVAGPSTSTSSSTSSSAASTNSAHVMPAIPVTPAIVSDSDESMHSASDDSQTPPLQNRRHPRSRGRPPGRHRRPVSPTPARQWTEHFTDEVPKRYTGPRPGPINDHSTKSVLETSTLP